ncbi:MAG: hypothetical protein ABH875_03865 [Candidatus Omnitrophota bacterium]
MKRLFSAKARDAAIDIVGAIELLLGLMTILFVILFDLFSVVEKPTGVFIFVIASATMSSLLGYGILNHRRWARILILFFSGYVIMLKILLYLDVIRFTGEILKIPTYLRDTSSIMYHIFIILFFTDRRVASKFENISNNARGGKRWRRKRS